MAEKQGIQEILELIEGLKTLASDAKAILADGKINLADLPVAMALLSQLGVLGAAVKGLDQVPAELKDLDAAELEQIGAKILELVAVIRGA